MKQIHWALTICFFAVLVIVLYQWKDETIFEILQNTEIKNSETAIFDLKYLIWYFTNGKSYDKENFFRFVGYIEKELQENEDLVFLTKTLKKIQDDEPTTPRLSKQTFFQLVSKKFSIVLYK